MDSSLRKKFDSFCQNFVQHNNLMPKEDREALFDTFRYAYLIGRKDVLEEQKHVPTNTNEIN